MFQHIQKSKNNSFQTPQVPFLCNPPGTSGALDEFPVSPLADYDISQADAEEVNTSTGKKRRFDISSTHGFSALSYARLPYAFVRDYSENNAGYNMMTRMPRFARRRVA